MFAFSAPLAVNVPPVRLKAPFSVEVVAGSFSVSEPPLMIKPLLESEFRPLMLLVPLL